MRFFSRGMGGALALSLLVTTTIPQGLQASSTVEYEMNVENSSQLIENAFNKFRYEMTVEWDQKDPYFKDYAQRELENSLLELKKRGITEEQVQDYMLNNMLSESAKKDYQRLITTLKKQGLSEEEASEQMMNFMSKNYQEGLGFSGGASGSYRGAIIIGVIVVGVVTYFMIKKHHEGERQEEEDLTTTGETTGETSGETSHGYTSGKTSGWSSGKTSWGHGSGKTTWGHGSGKTTWGNTPNPL